MNGNNGNKTSGSSILDRIIMNQKAEEVASLDAVEIITNLFNELSERERDVLIRRYGLHGSERETLENIGNRHNLTRERIRQIETSSVKKLRQLERLEEYISTLKKVIIQLLEEHGGMMERAYLLDALVNFSIDGLKNKPDNRLLHGYYLDFLISKLLYNDFELVTGAKHFKHIYKLKYQSLDHFEALIEELYERLKEMEKIISTEALIDLIKKLKAYESYRDQLQTENNIDLSNVLKRELYEEQAVFINRHKPLYSLIRAARRIEQNKFGHWGISHWREIKPKTINDKIYLVLKNHSQPMHFAEIADRINQISFDAKKANAATVHNELILDDKYVLVGRGLYGLKEWGYERGTVSDVIAEIVAASSQPLTRDQIIDKVLEKRLVKRATIILALMNKNRFIKTEGRYYLKPTA